MTLQPKQTLELDLALPPECLDPDVCDLDANDALLPVLRLALFTGYALGRSDGGALLRAMAA